MLFSAPTHGIVCFHTISRVQLLESRPIVERILRTSDIFSRILYGRFLTRFRPL
uniref:AlNc14C105G6181 protein n=1 Tax=Albugo laibachii Nc14 TaxID=890382 RepID=F0WHX5_9STRA|nr:AlNc14C105G6181 [Albugo laibachii Nc14]|eukprot:CCA20851.1 AlNc14C105G6181 [Albugo laibachii Nc14]